ncbi:hypothetical protein [Micromonospora coerulea]|uniref:hypothetical protein n=1 Tax=Micromonospora coerulea TaxID=47856 RepID=UPI001907B6C8|nr:hypothetical protein [Micromonospora veneta]
MRLFPKPDPRVNAVAASLAAAAPLVMLVIWRPEGVVAVLLALLCVLLGMVAGVAVTAARQSGGTPAPAARPPAQPVPAGYGVDADTLEALDSRAVRDSRALYADTLEALDSRAVQGSRAANGISDR